MYEANKAVKHIIDDIIGINRIDWIKKYAITEENLQQNPEETKLIVEGHLETNLGLDIAKLRAQEKMIERERQAYEEKVFCIIKHCKYVYHIIYLNSIIGRNASCHTVTHIIHH